MINLDDAEVCISTRLSVESDCCDSVWLRLGDYSSLTELYADCAGWFILEENPEYLFVAWDGIPDTLINREWICPNIFDILDVLRELGPHKGYLFLSWCDLFKWDLTSEDPRKALTEYNYSTDNSKNLFLVPGGIDEEEDATEDIYEELYCDEVPDAEDEYFIRMAGNGYDLEIFDDNYN